MNWQPRLEMIPNLHLHWPVALGIHDDGFDLYTLLLSVIKAMFCQPLEPLLVFRHNVADQCWLFVPISSKQRLALADQMVSSQVAIDFIELDPETPYFDLIISSACNCAIPRIVQIIPQVASPVDPVSWALVILFPGLISVISNFIIGLNPLLVVDEPVVKELLLGFLQVI